MDPVPLNPPFDPSVIRQIAARSAYHYWHDATDTVEFLLRHQSNAAMTAAIRAAWEASALPVKSWAGTIEEVRAWTNSEFTQLYLKVIRGGGEEPVFQFGPILREALEHICTQLGCDLPGVLRDVALTCPGITLNDTGELGSTAHFREPLRHLRNWIGEPPTEIDDLKYWEALDAQASRMLIEVAGDGIGNLFALGRDERVYFFDHEEPELRVCGVSLEELVMTYFSRPECVFDNEFLGL